MAKNNKTLTYRVGQLEETIRERGNIVDKSIDKLDEKIDDILINHLPHINNDIIGMKTKVNVLTAINIGAIILAIIISKIF